MSSLSSLTELNLRRNFIEHVTGLERLPMLQRVYLSHNLISSLGDIECLFKVKFLLELSLDGNPVASRDPVAYRNAIIMVTMAIASTRRYVAEIFMKSNWKCNREYPRCNIWTQEMLRQRKKTEFETSSVTAESSTVYLPQNPRLL